MQAQIWKRLAQCKDCPFESGSEEVRYLAEDNETIVYEHCFECYAGECCYTDEECERMK